MKLFKIFVAIIFLSSMLFNSACKKEKVVTSDPPLTPQELFFTNCGKIPPIIACINGARFYIPNSFSPNADGFNDVFHPFAAEGIQELISFKIFDEGGSLIFQESNVPLHLTLGNPQSGWDGKYPDGSVLDGIYSYTISISNTLGEIAEFEGAVCSRTTLPLLCVQNEAHLAWGTQHDGNGGFSFALPSYEDCE